jgi:hypothetical protein
MAKREKLKAKHRELANPRQFNEFLDGGGALANREQVAQRFDYDWHARKLTFDPHFRGEALMQATEYSSVRDHQWAAAHDPLFTACAAGLEISVSGLAQANRERPIEPFLVLLQQVMDSVARLPHRRLRAVDKETWQGIVGLLKHTDMFDATRLKLPPKVREWAKGIGSDQAALKLHLRIGGENGSFKKILLTPEPGPDAPYLEPMLGDLEQQSGQLFLFDGGYWKIDRYHAIVESGNHFVTKQGGNIQPHIVQDLPLPEEPLSSGYQVLQDARVTLGDRPDRVYRMLHVRLTTGEEITLLSSLVNAKADDICLLHRYRWTIEILFRWLRQTLQLDHWMSHSPSGILRQILMALIVWGLLVIANQDSGKLSPKQLWRELQASVHQAAVEFGYRLGLQGAELTFE